MKKIFMILVLSFLMLPTFASARVVGVTNVPKILSVKSVLWSDINEYAEPNNNIAAVAGFDPILSNFEIRAKENLYIKGLQLKVSNPDFVPAIEKIYFWYDVNSPANTPLRYQKEVTVAADGTATIPAGGINIYIPRNGVLDMEVHVVIKKDGGGVSSGVTTTIALAIDSASQTLTPDFIVETKTGTRIQGEMVQLEGDLPPTFVLRYAFGRAYESCRNFDDCGLDEDVAEPRVGYYSFAADKQMWENSTIPSPTLQSVRFKLKGKAIGKNIGDNQLTVKLYTVIGPVYLGEITVTGVDNGGSAEGNFVINTPISLKNGSNLIVFTVDRNDDDLNLADKVIKDFGIQLTGFTWSDGSASDLNTIVNLKYHPILFNSLLYRPKMDITVQKKNVGGISSIVVTATALKNKQSKPLQGMDMHVSSEYSAKDYMPVVKHCDFNLSLSGTCVYSAPFSSFRKISGTLVGDAFFDVTDNDGMQYESAVKEFIY